MGAFLEKPKTEKTTSSGDGSGLRYGVSAMQGWRMEMEDAHVCCTSIGKHRSNNFLEDWSFFGVFDGHAGPKASQYCSKQLLDCVMDGISDVSEVDIVERVKEGISKGFLVLDERLRELPEVVDGKDRSGTTAIVVMVSPTKIIWANCGDSRGLLCRSGNVHFATTDHKPFHVNEKSRIEKAGGTVMMQRVNGSLAVSRALGDFDYKRSSELPPIAQLVSPEPEITVHDREFDHDEFLLLACDGIFDVMSNEEVAAFVHRHLKTSDNLEIISSKLIDTCLYKNSKDNMSAIIITFPSCPHVSQEAIDAEKALDTEICKAIEEQLKRLADDALDPLDLEENFAIKNLSEVLEGQYDVSTKRPFISERLQQLRKEKFGNSSEASDVGDFGSGSSGGHDFRFTFAGKDIVVSSTSCGMGEDETNPFESPFIEAQMDEPPSPLEMDVHGDLAGAGEMEEGGMVDEVSSVPASGLGRDEDQLET